MKLKGKQFLCIFLVAHVLGSCQDTKAVVDTNQEITRRNWNYTEKIQVPVTIESTDKSYNLYVNLRHTPDYKYSNIFLLIHTTGPDGKRISERKEFKLALPDGEWLGSGSGNMYSHQLLFKGRYKFPLKGKYTFELEQNMRDNPLNDVTDVGMRVEKSN